MTLALPTHARFRTGRQSGASLRPPFALSLRLSPRSLASIVIAACIPLQSATAGLLYWDTNGATVGSGAATGTWGTSSFWSTDSTGASATANTATTSADDLFFSAGTSGTTGTITVNGTQNARLITLEEAALTFSGGTIALGANGGFTVLAGAGNGMVSSNLTLGLNNTFNIGTGRNLTFQTGVISGASGVALTKSGAGTLTLSGANDYSGVTTVNQGTLALSNGSALGTTSAGTVIQNDGAAFTGLLSLSGGITVNEPLTVFSPTNKAVITSTSGANTLGGPITQTGGGQTITVTGGSLNVTGPITGYSGSQAFITTVSSGATLTLSSINLGIGNSGNFYQNTGTGTVILNGPTFFGNATWQLRGGTLKGGASNALQRTADLQFGAYYVTTTATLDLGGFDHMAGQLSDGAGSGAAISNGGAGGAGNGTAVGTPNGIITNSGSAATLTLRNGTATFSGPIQQGTNALGLTKAGTGVQTLAGVNTYTGATTVNAGTLTVDFGKFATGTTTALSNYLSSSSNLTLGGGTFTVQGHGDGSATSGGSWTRNANGATQTLIFGTLPTGLVVGQPVSGTGIPGGAFIVAIIDATTKLVKISAPATAASGTDFASSTANFTSSQTVNGLTLNAGSSNLQVANTGSNVSTVLNLGAITRNAGGVVNFTIPSGTQSVTNGITTATTNTNGLLGSGLGWATVGGTDFATNATNASGGNIIAYAGYTGLSLGTGTDTVNSLQALSGTTTFTGSRTTNSLKLTNSSGSPQILSIGTPTTPLTLTLTSGGLLVTGTNSVQINNGTLKPSASEVIIHQYNSVGLTIGSVIANGTGASALTKAGTGILTLNADNTYTGATTVGSGNLTLAGKLLGGGAITVNGSGSLTTSGTISGASSLTIAAPGQTSTLGGVNYYTGTTTVDSGTLNVTGSLLGGGNLSVTGEGTFTQSTTGIIGGATSITHSSNSLTSNLSGTNTYTGTTAIHSGQLQFGRRVSLYNAQTASWTASNLIVAGGATAAFNVGGSGEFTSSDVDVLKGLGTGSGGFTNGAFLGLDTSNVATTFFTYGSNIANPNGGTNVLGLTKLGTNTLILSGASTYTGRTLVSAGTLSLTGSLADTAIVVNGGNFFQPTSGAITSAASFMHNSTATNTVLGGANTYTGYTAITGGTVTLTGSLSNSAAIGVGGGTFTEAASGVISGATAFSMGGGTATLAGANTYTGDTSIGGGTLTVTHALGLGSTAGSTTVASAAYLRLSGGVTITGETLFAAGDSNNQLSLQSNGGTTTWTGNVVSNGTIFLRIGASAGNALVISGNINNGGQTIVPQEAGSLILSGVLSGTGGLTIATGSAGSYTMSGANTYIGQTSINGSTATIYTLENSGVASSLGAAIANNLLQIGNGAATGTLRYVGTGSSTDRPVRIGNNSGPPVSGDTGGSTIQGDGTGTLTFSNSTFNTPLAATIANRTLTLQGFNTGLNTISGVIADNVTATGKVALIKAGPGTWRLSGANTYTNGTTVNGGTLLWSGANNLPATGTLQVNAGGNFSLADGTARTTSTAALNLATGANLSFDWNAGSLDTLTSTAAATTAGNVGIILNNTSPTGSGGNLISSTNGGLAGATYFLANNTNFTATLTANANNVTIGAQTSATALTDAYWLGGQVTNALGTMAFSSGTTSNWASDAGGTPAGGVVPGGSSVNIIFGATGAAQQANVTTGADMNLGSLTFNDSTAVTIAGSNTITLNSTSPTAATSSGSGSPVTPGSAVTVTSSANPTNTMNAGLLLGANQTWNVASAKTLVVSGTVAGSGSLTKADAGTLTLSGANTFTGGLTLNAGTLNINNASALGADPGTFTINGGTIDNTTGGLITIGNANNPVTINSDFTFTGTQSLNLGAGAVSLGTASGTTRTITTTGAASTLTLGGNIANGTTANALTKAGPGTLVLAGTDSYTGATTIDAGTLSLTGALTGGTAITVTGSAVLNESAAGKILGASSLTHASTGTSTLSGSNAYTGATTITAGTLRLANAGALGGIGGQTSGVSVNSGATLDLNGISPTVNAGLTLNGTGASGAGALANSGGATSTYNGLLTLGSPSTITTTQNIILSNPGIITGAGFDLTLNGTATTSSNIASSIGTGTGGLIKSGTGNWIISGANTYTGATTINQGTLRLGSTEALGTGIGNQTSGVSVTATGAALDLNGFSPAAGAGLTLNGTGVSNAGALLNTSTTRSTYTGLLALGSTSSIVATSGDIILSNAGTITGAGTSDLTLNAGTGTSNSLASVIGTGAGGVTKTGAGTWVLTGASTYTGVTNLNGGTLVVSSLADGGSPSNLGQAAATSTNLVLNSGRLQYNGTGSSTDRLFDLTASSTLASSGTGPLNFTGTGGYTTAGTASARILTLTGYNTGANTLAGVIQNSGTSPNITSVTKQGTGNWVLSGANTYTGTTTVNGGNLILDYATSNPLPATTGTLTINSGTLTFKGKSGGSSQTVTNLGFNTTTGAAKLVFDGTNGSTALNASTLSGGTILGASLIDFSGSIGSSFTVSNFSASFTQQTSSNNLFVFWNGSAPRAGILVKDSGGVGFATVTATTNGAVSKVADASLTTLPSGVNGTGTTNYLYNGANDSKTLGSSGTNFANNTVTVDTTNGTATINAAGRTIEGTAVAWLFRGGNDATINTTNTTTALTVNTFALQNYLTGDATLRMNGSLALASTSIISGPGFTTYSGSGFGNANNNGVNLIEGTLRVTTAQNWDVWGTTGLSNGAGNGWFRNAGVLELGADMSSSGSADFSNHIVTAAGFNGIIFYGDSGVSAAGATRTFNFGGGSAGLTWGANGFLVNPNSTSTDGNSKLLLSSTRSDAMVEIVNPVSLNNLDRIIEVADGSASVDARLSGAISGSGAGFTKTGTGTLALSATNTYTGATIVSGGTLLIDGNQSTATGNLTVSSGATLGGTGTLGGATTIGDGATITAGTDGNTNFDDLVFANDLSVGQSSGTETTWLVDLVHGDNAQVDLIRVTGGSLSLVDTRLVITATGTFVPNYANRYRIAQYSGSIGGSGTFLDLPEDGVINNEYRISYGEDESGYITLTAVPEPETWVPVVAVLCLGVYLQSAAADAFALERS